MGILLRSGPKHPLFRSWKTVPGAKAAGVCTAVSGTHDELIAAASRGVVATHAVFPVLRAGGLLLTNAERDQLWESWEVPIYAILLDAGGRVVAYECEAQEGLHLSSWAPLIGTVESSPCECGRPGDRWMPARSHASSAA
jgi:hypothetical protein